MQKQVVIDCFPESAIKYRRDYAIVAVDVIRATTSAITVAARGGRCLPVPSVDAAFQLREELKNALLVGEIGGSVPAGFDMNNSPADLARLDLTAAPVILLSSSGTRLIHEAKESVAVHLACFRNYGFVARRLMDRFARIAVIGAGSRGEFREEDQMCCAWIARDLAEMGHAPGDQRTLNLIKHWATEPPEAALTSRSAEYLRRTGQTKDLDFILAHVNDLQWTYEVRNGEVITSPDYEPDLAVAPGSGIGPRPEAQTVC